MKPIGNSNFSRHQRGMALVVALILLLVMTMVAVVATRTTTVDLKMTTNTTLARRAFQIPRVPGPRSGHRSKITCSIVAGHRL